MCDKTLQLFDGKKLTHLHAPRINPSPVTAAAVAWPRIALGHHDGVIRIYGLDGSSTIEIPVPGPPIDVKSMAMTPDGSRVAIAWVQGSIWWWDTKAPDAPHKLVRHESEADAISFNDDGSLLAEEGEPRYTTVWSFAGTPAEKTQDQERALGEAHLVLEGLEVAGARRLGRPGDRRDSRAPPRSAGHQRQGRGRGARRPPRDHRGGGPGRPARRLGRALAGTRIRGRAKARSRLAPGGAPRPQLWSAAHTCSRAARRTNATNRAESGLAHELQSVFTRKRRHSAQQMERREHATDCSLVVSHWQPWLAAGTSACSTQLGESTSGELGRVDFSYGASCFFGCSMDRPVLIGADERVDVTGDGDAPGVSAKSTDPGVVTFKLRRSCACGKSSGSSAEGMSTDAQGNCPASYTKTCDNAVDMQTVAAGDAKLELYDAGGQLIDRVGVHVRPAKSLRFEQQQSGSDQGTPIDQLEVPAGGTATLSAKLFDADGQPLIARHAVTWTSQDPGVAGFPSYSFFKTSPVDDTATDQSDWISVQGVQPGTTSITVQVSGLVQAVPVTVSGTPPTTGN